MGHSRVSVCELQKMPRSLSSVVDGHSFLTLCKHCYMIPKALPGQGRNLTFHELANLQISPRACSEPSFRNLANVKILQYFFFCTKHGVGCAEPYGMNKL